jgi:hypothetical protein
MSLSTKKYIILGHKHLPLVLRVRRRLTRVARLSVFIGVEWKLLRLKFILDPCRHFYKKFINSIQATLKTLDSTDITKKTCKDTRDSLNALGKENTVVLEWVKAHVGILGNE